MLALGLMQVWLDHARVVAQFTALLDSFFASFVPDGSAGMQRPDPQVGEHE